MNYPVISISIATYNSDKTLLKTLECIKKQTYPRSKIEILIVDGGSTDKTLLLAKKYRSKIVPNKKTDIVYARHLGFVKATGKYLMYLDSDEIMESENSLMLKYRTFKKNKRIIGIMPSGYKTPTDYAPINYYVNEFGDPFSFYMYRESKGIDYLVKEWIKRYPVIQQDTDCIVLDLSNIKPLPLIELSAGGCVINLSYMRARFPKLTKYPGYIGHLFYLFNENGGLLAITKHDNLIHYSSASLQKYLKKIDSRIKNNVFGNDMGKAGFSGREKFQSSWYYYKKILFIPYAFLLILPIIDSIYLAITRKKIIYLLHVFLSVYTALLIIYYTFLKIMRVTPDAGSYGN